MPLSSALLVWDFSGAFLSQLHWHPMEGDLVLIHEGMHRVVAVDQSDLPFDIWKVALAALPGCIEAPDVDLTRYQPAPYVMFGPPAKRGPAKLV